MKKTISSWTRAHIFYSGRVQGVGFRFTAERLALDLRLRGWVKNLPDGRVEVVCEGSKEKIDKYLVVIHESPLGIYIKKRTVEWLAPTREFKDFTVEFC